MQGVGWHDNDVIGIKSKDRTFYEEFRFSADVDIHLVMWMVMKKIISFVTIYVTHAVVNISTL